jgi:hypothetical protein
VLLLARADVPVLQARDRLLDDGQRPLPFEDSLGREEVLQRCDEKGAELALGGVDGLDCFLFEQVSQEGLR